MMTLWMMSFWNKAGCSASITETTSTAVVDETPVIERQNIKEVSEAFDFEVVQLRRCQQVVWSQKITPDKCFVEPFVIIENIKIY